MNNCIFCKIINGEIPTDFLLKTKNIIVFKDINPKAPIHYLIVPKIHIKSLNKAKSSDKAFLGELLLIPQKIAKKLKIKDYKIIINTGSNAGQSVDHLHLHFLAQDFKKSGQV